MKRISFILFSTVHFACWCSFLFQSWELSLLRSSICLSLHNVFTCSSKRSCASPSNSSVSPSQPLYCGSGLLKIIPPVWCSVVIISEQSSRCLKIYILYRSSRVFLFRVPSDLRIPSATRPHSVTILAIVHGMLHRYSYGFTGHALILTLGLHWTPPSLILCIVPVLFSKFSNINMELIVLAASIINFIDQLSNHLYFLHKPCLCWRLVEFVLP